MCGIGGIYIPVNQQHSYDLTKILDVMCHIQRDRGPDDSGIWENGHVGFSATRLQIVGNESYGKMPIHDLWGNVLVFNGEIYDHPRPELGSQYIPTMSDGYSLSAILHKKGPNALRDVSGMFAAALYNKEDKSLLLVRDAVGQKPLYIRQINGVYVFASKLAAVLNVTGSAELREDAVYEYLSFKSVGGNQTFYKGITQLPAGSWLKIYPDGSTKSDNWWHFPDPSRTKSKPEEVFNILMDSVEKRNSYDKRTAIFLSGGLDSGIVAALANRQKNSSDLTCLSIGYDIKGMEDETLYSKRLANDLDLDIEVIQLNSGDIEDLYLRAAEITEEPNQDPVVLPTILLASYASSFTKVVLTGDGSDELWGGYSRFDNFDGDIWDYLPRAAIFSPNEIGLNEYPKSYLNGIVVPDEKLDPLDRVFRLEIGNRMRNYHLSRIDKVTMAMGLEARCPFLDIKVLEAGLQLPYYLKRPDKVPKGLLLEAFKDILPEWLIQRKKQPFSLPIQQWLSGPLKVYCHDTLRDPNAFIRGFIQPDNILDSFDRVQDDHKLANKIWSLLQLEAWNQSFLHSNTSKACM